MMGKIVTCIFTALTRVLEVAWFILLCLLGYVMLKILDCIIKMIL